MFRSVSSVLRYTHCKRRSFSTFTPLPALSENDIRIVKSTAPLFRDHGFNIVKNFYERLFQAHPALLHTFNISHQRSGSQPAALASSVFAYATHIDRPEVLRAAVARITHKHASLNVQPEHYPIVGEHLMAAVKEVVGSETITPEVADAWQRAYATLADLLIREEQKLYANTLRNDGGWIGWRDFVVTEKIPESAEAMSFVLQPVDGGVLPRFQAGQYISVKRFVPAFGYEQPRQYSLTSSNKVDHFRITVKREELGHVSNILHSIEPGSTVQVSSPYGEFTIDTKANTPIVLISAGIGITPMIAMLNALDEVGNHSRPIVFVHAARDRGHHVMKSWLNEKLRRFSIITRSIWYEAVNSGEQPGGDFDHIGRVNLPTIRDQIVLPQADYYLCGPPSFMAQVRKELAELGIELNRVHHETFDADGSLANI